MEEIDIDWDNRWLLGDDSAAHFYGRFLIDSRRLFVGFYNSFPGGRGYNAVLKNEQKEGEGDDAIAEVKKGNR